MPSVGRVRVDSVTGTVWEERLTGVQGGHGRHPVSQLRSDVGHAELLTLPLHIAQTALQPGPCVHAHKYTLSHLADVLIKGTRTNKEYNYYLSHNKFKEMHDHPKTQNTQAWRHALKIMQHVSGRHILSQFLKGLFE